MSENNREAIDDFAREHFPFNSAKDRWFIHKDRPETDRDAFFGPIDGHEEFTVIDDTTNIFHILAKAGAFPSASQARKNWKNVATRIGWHDESDHSIPDGFTMFTVGKKKLEVVILK